MSKTKQNARLLADAEHRLQEITVKKIEPVGYLWRVAFSHPVYYWVCDTQPQSDVWYASDENDELDVFKWALRVIDEHKKRVAREANRG